MSILGSIVVCDRDVIHVPLIYQCIYGRSGEGVKNRNGGEENEISG